MSMIWGASLVTSSAALAMNNTTMAPDAGDLPYLLFRSTNRDLLSHLMHYFWSTWPFDGAKRFISVIWVQEIPTTFLVSCSFWWSSLFFVSYLRSGFCPISYRRGQHKSRIISNLEYLHITSEVGIIPTRVLTITPKGYEMYASRRRMRYLQCFNHEFQYIIRDKKSNTYGMYSWSNYLRYIGPCLLSRSAQTFKVK